MEQSSTELLEKRVAQEYEAGFVTGQTLMVNGGSWFL